jgi:hypothetical protein
VIEIRSFRKVFDLERRIYRVDRLRLNPGGVPLRGIVYFLAIVALDLVLAELPLLDGLARALPWFVRDALLPGAAAALLGVIRIEGRPFHLAAQALVRHAAGPRHSSGGWRRASVGRRWWPDELLMLPDGSDARVRRLRYSGPGAVLVVVEHRRTGTAIERGSTGLARRGRRPTVTLQAPAGARTLDRAQVIVLERGARLLARERRRLGRGR